MPIGGGKGAMELTINKDFVPPPQKFGRRAKLITIDLDKLIDWKSQAKKINSIDDLAKRVELNLMDSGAPKKEAVQEKPPTPQGKILHRHGAFDWPPVIEKTYPNSRPIEKLQLNLSEAIKTKQYHMIRGHIEELQKTWPMSPRQYVRGLENAILMSCEKNDPRGLAVCVHTIGYLPPEICGRALYVCAMHGNALAAKEVLPFTNETEQKRALFKAVELRHGHMITLLLNFDKQRELVNDMVAGAGGGQTLLGHALELGAETGDCALATAALNHMYDERVHAGPRFNDPRPKFDAFGRPILLEQTERAHLWCWPFVIRAKNVATVRGNEEVAHILQMWCHGSRPSAPSTARLADNHSHHSGSIQKALGRHKIHRYQKKWHPRELTSVSNYDASTAQRGWSLTGSVRSIPRSYKWDGVKQIKAGRSGFMQESSGVFNESTMETMTMRSRGGASGASGTATRHVMGLLNTDMRSMPTHALDGGDSGILTTASMGSLLNVKPSVDSSSEGSGRGGGGALLPGLGGGNAAALAAKLEALQVSGAETWAVSAGINGDLDADSFREADRSVRNSRFYQYGIDMPNYRAAQERKAETKRKEEARDRALGIISL
jgi:hypothetical protein